MPPAPLLVRCLRMTPPPRLPGRTWLVARQRSRSRRYCAFDEVGRLLAWTCIHTHTHTHTHIQVSVADFPPQDQVNTPAELEKYAVLVDLLVAALNVWHAPAPVGRLSSLPVMELFKSSRPPAVFLREQHRMVAGIVPLPICSVISQATYRFQPEQGYGLYQPSPISLECANTNSLPLCLPPWRPNLKVITAHLAARPSPIPKGVKKSLIKQCYSATACRQADKSNAGMKMIFALSEPVPLRC